MAKVLMVQGTMSNVGKSILVAGLCRIFHQDGYKVAPFKSQNMALNSFITKDGLEMGRAQVVQAEACGAEPSVLMNPILLKPTTDVGSQVIVNGEVIGNYRAADYYEMKKNLWPDVEHAFNTLCDENEIVVVEGAGSPAEINLKQDDFVNMGLAKRFNIPVLLVGDIDRGGVFAQLAGTQMLLDENEKVLLKATVINKFRGDVSILRPGLSQLESIMHRPVAGVLPMLDIDIEDEDSLTDRFSHSGHAQLDVAVVRLPRISNFTDLAALEATEGVSVRYITKPQELGNPDAVILPGTKSTISDLKWLRQNGLEAAILHQASKGTIIVGICGGYQMLGKRVTDACGAEGGGTITGLGLLPTETAFEPEKHRTRISGIVSANTTFTPGTKIEGYEIHMGKTTLEDSAVPLLTLENGQPDGCVSNNVFGCYIHGFFDSTSCRQAFLDLLCRKKNINPQDLKVMDYAEYKEQQFNILADAIRNNLDMEMIYRILNREI